MQKDLVMVDLLTPLIKDIFGIIVNKLLCFDKISLSMVNKSMKDKVGSFKTKKKIMSMSPYLCKAFPHKHINHYIKAIFKYREIESLKQYMNEHRKTPCSYCNTVYMGNLFCKYRGKNGIMEMFENSSVNNCYNASSPTIGITIDQYYDLSKIGPRPFGSLKMDILILHSVGSESLFNYILNGFVDIKDYWLGKRCGTEDIFNIMSMKAFKLMFEKFGPTTDDMYKRLNPGDSRNKRKKIRFLISSMKYVLPSAGYDINKFEYWVLKELYKSHMMRKESYFLALLNKGIKFGPHENVISHFLAKNIDYQNLPVRYFLDKPSHYLTSYMEEMKKFDKI